VPVAEAVAVVIAVAIELGQVPPILAGRDTGLPTVVGLFISIGR
jgi:hypothetical protein